MSQGVDRTGSTLRCYRITARIGAGGMGEVYRARDEKLQRDVAVKLLPRHVAIDRDGLDRFRREAQAASALNHPNVLIVHELDEEDGRPYIVTEYVEGQTLRERLSGGPLPIREVLDIAVQVASALAAAHDRGILHRDVKPENVMVRPDGYVKVLDFGLAKMSTTDASEVQTQTGMLVGTPAYMSPEQARALPLDFRSDQFSFGVMLYELLTGRSPFLRDSLVETAAAILHEASEPIDRACPQAPPPLRWAIDRCLAKEPHERYASTRDLHRELCLVRERFADVRPAALSLAGSNLPIPQGALVGRDDDVAAVRKLIGREDVRWVTLTGPGGVGKTRLSIEVAASVSAQFSGSVYFIALSNVADFRLVPSAIAEALDIRPQPGEGVLEALKRHFRASMPRLLLVVDNFEHVADAAPAVAELLGCSAGLKVLASSRARLHVSAEREYQVPTLGLPDPKATRSAAAFASAPAVALFVERARAVKPDFELTGQNASAVADICFTLDGLPLAIELAAARIKVLPPAALFARLSDKRLALAGGARDLPIRQQALRNTIEWSYGLLTPEEQRLFRRLAVFAGGWTLEAAEAVCDARGDLDIDVLDGIESLVDKSLVRSVESRGDARFMMLGTIREYGLERLADAGDAHVTQKAHAAYALVLAEEGAGATEAAAQVQWLASCDVEHTNLRAALDHLIESGEAEWAVRLASALLPFWQARAHLAEARDRLTRVLAMPDAREAPEAWARAALALGTVLYSMGEPAHSSSIHMNDVLPLYQTLGDRRGMAVCLNATGVCRRAERRYAEARDMIEQALSIWREVGDELAAARTLSNLAAIAFDEGQNDRATELYREVRSACTRTGDRSGAAWALNFEAQVALARGDADAARALFQEALAAFRAIRDSWGTGDSLLALGYMACERAPDEARRLFTDAYAVFAESGDTRGLVRVVDAFTCLAVRDGKAVLALKLAGAAAAIRQSLAISIPAFERDHVARALDVTRREADAAVASTAWAEGWAMTADEALQLAIT